MTERRPRGETARLGEEIYERDIHPLVKDAHDGEFVAIDVETGSWAIGNDELDAANCVREQRPEAIDVWLVRVGYRAVASLGGGAPPRRE